MQTEELEDMLGPIYRKDPHGLLAIEAEFESYVSLYDPPHSLRNVVSGKIPSGKVAAEKIAAIRKVVRLARRDELNMRRCTAFVRRNFPHAIFSSGDFTIGVNNLSAEEIKRCMKQRGMKFTYYKN